MDSALSSQSQAFIPGEEGEPLIMRFQHVFIYCADAGVGAGRPSFTGQRRAFLAGKELEQEPCRQLALLHGGVYKALWKLKAERILQNRFRGGSFGVGL